MDRARIRARSVGECLCALCDESSEVTVLDIYESRSRGLSLNVYTKQRTASRRPEAE